MILPFLLLFLFSQAVEVRHIHYNAINSTTGPRLVVIHRGLTTTAMNNIIEAIENSPSLSASNAKLYSVNLNNEPIVSEARNITTPEIIAAFPDSLEVPSLTLPEFISPKTFDNFGEYLAEIDEVVHIPPDPTYIEQFVSEENIVDVWLRDRRPVLVAYTASWCDPCIYFKFRLARISGLMKGKIRFIDADCPTNTFFCSAQNVNNYPTLMYFTGAWHQYDGDLSSYSLKKLAEWLLWAPSEAWNGAYTIGGLSSIPLDPVTSVAFEKIYDKAVREAAVSLNMTEEQVRDRQPRWKETTPQTMADVSVMGKHFLLVTNTSSETTAEMVGLVVKYLAKHNTNKDWAVWRIDFSRNDEYKAEIDPFEAILVAANGAEPQLLFQGEYTLENLELLISDITKPADLSLVHNVTDGRQLSAIIARARLPAVVAFKATWCGHCRSMEPNFARAAAMARDKAVFLQVFCDMDEMKDVCVTMRVQSFPQIKSFDGLTWSDYEGNRTPRSLAEFAGNVTLSKKLLRDAFSRQRAVRNEAQKRMAVLKLHDQRFLDEDPLGTMKTLGFEGKQAANDNPGCGVFCRLKGLIREDDEL